MLDLGLDRGSGLPLGLQLTSRLHSAIADGELVAGDRLPSLREAAEAAGVNVNTVRAVYAKLEAAGIVKTEQGRGTFVVDRRPSETPARRALHDEIARLEAELVALPLTPMGAEAPSPAGRPRLLSLDELAAVRDTLAQRVDELRAARGEIVRRLESPSPGDDAARAAQRHPSGRSSSTLAGARIRWTGA